MIGNISDNKRISSLDGLKMIMLFLIFCWHTPTNPNNPFGQPIVDLGARACEVLFVASGFLVGYNHYFKLIPVTLKQSWNYVADKLAKVWPAHIIGFILILIVLTKTNDLTVDFAFIFKALMNIFLLQSWTSDPFSFNSVMWFFSTLLFCYALSPLLMSVFKRNLIFITILSLLFISIRIILELNDTFFPFEYHTSPIIRCIEFFIGMLMVPFYHKVKSIMNHNSSNNSSFNITLIMSIIELIVSAIYIYLIIKMEGKWIRGYFVIAACFVVFIYSLDGGIISRFLSIKIIRLFAMIQLEFYVFHQVIIRLLESTLSSFIPSVFIQSIILFFIIVILSFLYKKFLKEKFTIAMKKILIKS